MHDSQPVIRPLDASTLPDFLHFFDHDAFADNPRWAVSNWADTWLEQ